MVEKVCKEPGCKKALRVDNKSGYCTTHRDPHSARRLPDSDDDGKLQTQVQLKPFARVPTIPALPSSAERSGSQYLLRDHRAAILHALHLSEDDTALGKQTVGIVDALGAIPVALVDENGVETNLLGAPVAISSLLGKQERGMDLTIVPSPKKAKIDIELQSTHKLPWQLEALLHRSPVRSLLADNEYTEMNDEAASLFNQDWLMQPQMRYFAARALSGAIVVDVHSGSAILVNTIEVYGRSFMVDAHHERCNNKKGFAAPSSNPPERSRYKDIWAITMQSADGYKLNIASKTFNALVTSSIRLDQRRQPDLGPTTKQLFLDETKGRNAKLFLSNTCYDMATQLAANTAATAIQQFDLLQQLRQVRSKFDDPSTYVPSRASSPRFNFHRLQPQTIFTYSSFDNGASNTDGKLASQVFAIAAVAVISNADAAVISKAEISRVLSKCTAGGRVADAIEKILAVFPGDATSVPILDNANLTAALKPLAEILSPYLFKANEIIIKEIEGSLQQDHQQQHSSSKP
ncbi:hypothetical protein BC940DRAFT_265819 [Gongronella butleri]|nr:hypothetical protein BC940DRAFT_265819 [Gongronella butleri]